MAEPTFIENTTWSQKCLSKNRQKSDIYGFRLQEMLKKKQNQSSVFRKARHYDAHVSLARSYDYFCNLTLFMIQITVISFIHLDYILLVWVQPKQLLI